MAYFGATVIRRRVLPVSLHYGAVAFAPVPAD